MSPVGFNWNLSLLDILFPGDLIKWREQFFHRDSRALFLAGQVVCSSQTSKCVAPFVSHEDRNIRVVLEFSMESGSKPMGSHFGVGEFNTHFRLYFSGDWDVHRGYDLDFDPWPHGI